jgi:lauroyl/myristoyl acyltransferase
MDMLYLGLRILAKVCPYLPMRLGRSMFVHVGDLAFHLSSSARADCLSNLRHVLGSSTTEADLRATGQQAFRHLALSYYDILRAHAFSDAQI